MMDNQKLKKETSCLVLCEGRDAKNFLIWLLDYYKKQGRNDFNRIQVEDFGGISQLKNALSAWRNISEFNQKIRALCVIRDSETDWNSASESVRNALRGNNYIVPDNPYEIQENHGFKTAYLLFPGSKNTNGVYDSGTLEDLCLSVIKDIYRDDKIKSIVDFLDSCKDKYDLQYPRIHKTKLHEYLALHDAYVDLKIGEAAKAGAFDFEHDLIKNIINVFDGLII